MAPDLAAPAAARLWPLALLGVLALAGPRPAVAVGCAGHTRQEPRAHDARLMLDLGLAETPMGAPHPNVPEGACLGPDCSGRPFAPAPSTARPAPSDPILGPVAEAPSARPPGRPVSTDSARAYPSPALPGLDRPPRG